MKLTIVPIDGAVYKDGKAYQHLTLNNIPADIHALQWNGVSGWLEFVDDVDGGKPVNEPITELPAWAVDAVAVWDAVKAEEDAANQAMLDSQPVVAGAQTL